MFTDVNSELQFICIKEEIKLESYQKYYKMSVNSATNFKPMSFRSTFFPLFE